MRRECRRQNSMPTTKRAVQKLAILARRTKVAGLYLQGRRTQAAIAADLGLCPRTVADDLAAIRREWRQAMVAQYEQAAGEELARLDQVEREAWAAWERSQTAREKSKSGRRTKAGVEETWGEIEREDRPGNPRFLEAIGRCIQTRMKLLGVGARPSRSVIVERELAVFACLRSELAAMDARVLGPAITVSAAPPAAPAENDPPLPVRV
jgi:hypothetical protein